MHTPPFPARAGAAAALALLLVPAAARADLLFLKDGFVLQGKVKRESVTEFDPVGKEPIIIPKGFFLLDDGPRRVYFSPTQVRIVEKMPEPVEERVVLKSSAMILNPKVPPPILEVVNPGEFNAKWQRTYTYRSTTGRVTAGQHLGLLTPSWARVDASTRFFWSAAYLTREWEPATVHRLLLSHPEFVEDKKLKPAQLAARRLRLCDFLAQAGWFDLAEKELNRLLKDLPEQKERVAAAKVALEKLRTRERREQVKRWHQAGRHCDARRAIAGFPEKYATEQMRSDLRALRARYHRTVTRLEQAEKHLAACAKEVTEPKHKLLAEAAGALLKELHYDNVERLDAFLGQAAQ